MATSISEKCGRRNLVLYQVEPKRFGVLWCANDGNPSAPPATMRRPNSRECAISFLERAHCRGAIRESRQRDPPGTVVIDFLTNRTAARVIRPLVIVLPPRAHSGGGELKCRDAGRVLRSEGSMTRQSELEASKERKRAYHRAYFANRYADPEFRARMQEYARTRFTEKRADPQWHAAHKKKLRKCYRTRGKSLPNRQPSRQRSYYKLAANPEWRERHNAKQRERYHNDPAFRARSLARKRLWCARMKNLRPNRRAKPR
jgi:hypothetical protein